MALAAFWFSLMGLLVKVCGERLPALQIVMARAVVTLVLSGLGLWRRGLAPWGQRRGLLIVRGLLGSAGMVCFYLAIQHMPLGDANAIHQTNPLWTALLAAWLLGEALDRRVLIGITLSLVGVGMITGMPIVGGGHAWGLVALLGALFAAGAYVTVRALRRTEPPLVIVFYFPLVTTPLLIVPVVHGWVAPTPVEWVALLGVGVTTQLAQVALTQGLQRESAGRAVAVNYLQVALALLWGLVFFGELPSLGAALGMVLIVAGVLFAAWRRRPAPTR